MVIISTKFPLRISRASCSSISQQRWIQMGVNCVCNFLFIPLGSRNKSRFTTSVSADIAHQDCPNTTHTAALLRNRHNILCQKNFHLTDVGYPAVNETPTISAFFSAVCFAVLGPPMFSITLSPLSLATFCIATCPRRLCNKYPMQIRLS